MTALLQVDDLTVRFAMRHGRGDDTLAVDGVSFSVMPGEVLAIVGESGCGKSASALAVMGLLPGSASVTGRVEFDGRSLLKLSDSELSDIRGRAMSMVFQDPLTCLNPVLTVGRQLREVIHRHERMGRREANARSVALLREVGIAEPERHLKSYPHQLSGGMRQRVMIAMAIACNPSLLIADEPTTALDATIQAQILELLKRLSASHAMALVLITHDLGVVAGMADRVAVMYGGRIVEQADRYEAFDHPQHRYTRGLLGSTPSLAGTAARMEAIPGSAFDRIPWSSGCSFAPRCAFASEECTNSALPLIDAGAGHLVRCANPAGPEEAVA